MDRVYDHIRSLGLYPVVEISFMPHDLASDPSKTVFDYGAIISPPKDWERWHDLVRDLTAHLLERYGDEVVEHWSFEVWNEANLEVFWSGTPEEYLQLYDVTAAAVRSVDARLVVGGPSSAAAGWVEELLAHADRTGAPVDFVSTHTYGSPPLDFRPMLERYGRAGHADLVDRVGRHADPLQRGQRRGLLRHVPGCAGMLSAMGRIESLSYWVVSDHFEELGRPPALLHGGFGLRTVGELRKPRWWALAMLERLGSRRLAVSLTRRRRRLAGRGGRRDGAGRPGRTRAGLEPHPRPDQGRRRRGARPRSVSVEVAGLAPGRDVHADARAGRRATTPTSRRSGAGCARTARTGRPTSSGSALRAADRLEELEPAREVTADDGGVVRVDTELPMPSMSLLTLAAVLSA